MFIIHSSLFILHFSLPVRLALTAVCSSALAWALQTYLPEYITIFGGLPAYIIIGSLLTLMNFLVRPILKLVTLPFKLIATLLTDMVVNGVFLWMIYEIALRMDPDIVALVLSGGVWGWIVVSSVLGFSHWVMKKVL